jgi:hypothetical protein
LKELLKEPKYERTLDLLQYLEPCQPNRVLPMLSARK